MKILITYAYAGIGHKKAAESIYNELSKRDGVDVKNIDILDHTNSFFKKSYPSIYLFLINKASLLWALLYYMSDNHLVEKILSPLRRMFQNIECKAFIEYILKERPDIIISTHFMSSEVISELKRKSLYNGRLVTVITDFMPHEFWLSSNVDTYIVALKRSKDELIKRGINKNIIMDLGIPCDDVFSEKKDKDIILKRIGAEKGLFNILIMSGGFGTGPIKKIIQDINKEDKVFKDKIQLFVVCGKNASLVKELSDFKNMNKINLNIFGYINNVDELMGSSDIIMTKSGGLTTSEALSKTLPMIIIDPIPGQETRNAKILLEEGCALWPKDTEEAIRDLKGLVYDRDKLNALKKNIESFSYHDTPKKIADLLMRHED